MEDIAQRLKWAREQKGLSQKGLAIIAGCSQGAIGNVESGERKTLRNIARIANILEVDALWLEDGTGHPHQIQVSSLTNLSDVAQWISIFGALEMSQQAQVLRLMRTLVASKRDIPLWTAPKIAT